MSSYQEHEVLDFQLFDSLVDSCCVIDRRGNIVFVNRKWKEFSENNGGNPLATGIQNNYLQVMRSSSTDFIKNGILSVLDGENISFECEYPCHGPNDQRWFLLRVGPIGENSGFFLLSHVDISKRRLTEIELSRSHENLASVNKRLELALSHLAHDIKGPLGSIKGLISLEKESNASPAYEMIINGITKLEQFISTTLSQGRKGTLENNKVAINLEDLIYDFLEQLKYNQELAGLNISVDVIGGGIIHSYLLDIQIIVRNLLLNAIKYRDHKKEESFIIVTVKCKADGVEFEVRDNGIGIHPEKQKSIFENRFRINSQISGSGVGLYLVKSAVEHLGGTISINSQAGEGATFNVWLPKNN